MNGRLINKDYIKPILMSKLVDRLEQRIELERKVETNERKLEKLKRKAIKAEAQLAAVVIDESDKSKARYSKLAAKAAKMNNAIATTETNLADYLEQLDKIDKV